MWKWFEEMMKENDMSETKDECQGMPDLSYCGTPRYMCTVLEEMREAIKSMNFSYMGSLVEEAQMLANRMEAGLDHVRSLKDLAKDLAKLKDARKALKQEVQDLIDKRDELKK